MRIGFSREDDVADANFATTYLLLRRWHVNLSNMRDDGLDPIASPLGWIVKSSERSGGG